MCIPNTRRMHDFARIVSSSRAILTGFTIETPDAANVVLQAIDGSVRISLGAGNACITDLSGYSQSVNCVLDLASTTRAFAFPRMTTGQIAAIQTLFPAWPHTTFQRTVFGSILLLGMGNMNMARKAA